MNYIQIQSLFTLFSHLMFILLAYWALQSVRLDFLRKNSVPQARVLFLLLAIALGFISSKFFLEFLNLCKTILLVFQ